MTVTQVLMGAGQWSVQFKDRLPQSIRDQILLLDHVVIGPAGLVDTLGTDAERLAAVDAANGYTGVILEIPDGFSLTGQDVSWWLGDTEGRGPTSASAIVRTSATNASVWLDQFLPMNGITKGTVSGGSSFSGTSSPYATGLELLNWVGEETATEWQMRPTFKVNMAPSTTLFPAPSTTSATVITKDPAGDEGGLSGVEAVALDRARDATAVVSGAVVMHSADADEVKFATATTTPAGVRWEDPFGGTPTRTLRLVAPNLRANRAATFASNVLSRVSIDQKEAMLTSRTYNVTSEVLPGARVWVYDLESGLYDTSNQVTWRGELIAPIQMRVHSLTWPITRGMGVYARLDGGATWLDLTPYVEFEDADVAWEVTISGRKRNASPVSTGLVSVDMATGRAKNRSAFITESSRSTTSARLGGWTPTVNNFSVGTGGSAKLVGKYTVANGTMTMVVEAVVGTTGAGRGASGATSISLPDGWNVDLPAGTSGIYVVGDVRVTAGGTTSFGKVDCDSSSLDRLRLRDVTVSGTRLVGSAWSSTVPGSWTSGDGFTVAVSFPVKPV